MKSTLLACVLATPVLCFGVTLGQVDTFDVDTAGWTVALGPGGGVHPEPPATALGGPGGAADMFLRLSATGGAGAGSKLAAMNVEQWAGDYTTAGIRGILMDVRNSGATDLHLRLLFENLGTMGPTDMAVSTTAIHVPSGSGWMSVMFPVTAPFLTNVGTGTIAAALAGADVLRIYSSETATFPPPGSMVATLDVDNIEASAIPEPATLLLTAAAFATLALTVRSRHC